MAPRQTSEQESAPSANGASADKVIQHDKETSWLHQEMQIRKVLDSPRRTEINSLMATSVVEEGVDVQVCSFVVMLNRLRSMKTSIQCKGRA
eukprot:CAMPEP_0202458958 /NCGR_PEP_ID=MMETSP1360-20130828/28703_1 /ASSEMBLY_ACC=CAM_ASM_000848 /TAXON_ID=515479 /ORGANISM="Licmophora paradoxa, Strain CCMP2313" /LENGTH=91 /DNA_ID=CAMNT_0049079727 /DNA_START=84 /DNA_END=359 /DNA_ORIENTATION=+